jgi:hypothetical protein
MKKIIYFLSILLIALLAVSFANAYCTGTPTDDCSTFYGDEEGCLNHYQDDSSGTLMQCYYEDPDCSPDTECELPLPDPCADFVADNITTCEHLQCIKNDCDAGNCNKQYKLVKNIDCSNTSLSGHPLNDAGKGFKPIGNQTKQFIGQFDGQGFNITGLYIMRQPTSYVGLFGQTNGSLIKNVGLINANITGRDYVGGIAGQSFVASSIINNCFSTGKITGRNYVGGVVGNSQHNITGSYFIGGVVDTGAGAGNYVGGLAGYMQGVTSNCYATGTVSGANQYVGGLIGQNKNSVSNSYANETITGIDAVGGLIGYNQGGSVSNSNSTGTVSGSTRTGGLIGWNTASVSNSHATGTVRGSTQAGGLIGLNSGGSVSNSHATGTITGTNSTGGLIGRSESGSVSNSYATGTVIGSIYAGGLIGQNKNSVSNSYATGTVNGTNQVGGLIGLNYEKNAIIINSYATGTVNGNNYVGGLIGNNTNSVSNSYATGIVSGQMDVGGLIGNNNQYASVSGSYWDICRTGQENCTGNNQGSIECTGVNINLTAPNDNYFYNLSNEPMLSWSYNPPWSNIYDNTGYQPLSWEQNPVLRTGQVCASSGSQGGIPEISKNNTTMLTTILIVVIAVLVGAVIMKKK